MPVIRVQHALQGRSGLPTDTYVNTFHFSDLAVPTGPDLVTLATAIKSFYADVAAGGGTSIKSFISGSAGADGASIKMYNQDDPMPREPIFSELYDFNLGFNGKALPSEVAVCLSYAAASQSGAIQARRRGRIYIGPLNDSASTLASLTERCRPTTAIQTALVQSALDLRSKAVLLGLIWLVYSPTGGSGASITKFWVDDAFDTQRRRGEAPTARLEVAVP